MSCDCNYDTERKYLGFEKFVWFNFKNTQKKVVFFYIINVHFIIHKYTIDKNFTE